MADEPTPSAVVAQLVRDLRVERRWSVRELAERCAAIGATDITDNVIENIERRRSDESTRKGGRVTVDHLMALASVLDVAPADLLRGVAKRAGGAVTVFLVFNKRGMVAEGHYDESTAHDTAKAIEGVVAELPIVGDYRTAVDAVAGEPRAEVERLRELLGNIWLYVNWRSVTRHLTTEQREMWADAVDAFGEPEPGKAQQRWWRDD